MNWYKKYITAGNKKVFTARTFLKALRPYGVIVERNGQGSRHILLNTNNNKRSNFHYHRLGAPLGSGQVANILQDLNIDIEQFMGIPSSDIEKYDVEESQDVDTYQEQTKNWKNSPWYQKQMQETQNLV